MAFVKRWYGILLVLLLVFVAGFLLGWAISGKILVSLLSASGGVLVGGLVGFLLRLWLNERGLTLAHQHRIVEDKAGRLHEYIEQYYLPMCSRAERLQESLDTIKSNPSPEQVRLSFFRVVQWFGIIKKWIQEKGGTIFLEDLTAERVIKDLLNRTQQCFVQGGYVDTIDLFRILEKANSNQTWSEFEQELSAEPINTIFHKYEQWIANANLQLCSSYLRFFYLLLGFEIDTTLRPWYKRIATKSVFKKTEQQKIRKLVNGLKEEEKYKEKYLRKIGIF
jgi:hypothetical protein